MTKKQTITALAFVTVSSIAWAGSGAATFQDLDKNRDGQITLDEAKKAPAIKDQFSEADTNKDGKLDAAEFAAIETAPTDSMPKE